MEKNLKKVSDEQLEEVTGGVDGVSKATLGKAHAGKAIAGKAMDGKALTGKAVTGKSSAGKSCFGKNQPSKAASGILGKKPSTKSK